MKKYWVLFLVVGIGVVLAAGVAFGSVYYFGWNSKPQFRTVTVERGNVTGTIGASGTIEPEDTIDIGAQVVGVIKKLGDDPKNPGKTVDYCTEVEPGMVLAQIDDAVYAAAVDKAKADLGQAQANVDQAKFNLESLEAKLRQTEADWKRVEPNKGKGVLSDYDYDTSKNAYETAKATVPGGKAALAQAEAMVATDKALLNLAVINLNYCTIKSPVKGVIIDRRVNVGQTVVSSLTAPSLFLLAKDLTKIQIWVAVNEADIGNIRKDQKVTFTVDAYPREVFKGTVTQIRLNASSTQNVVTYTVVVTTDNPPTPEKPNGRLFPYMTANVQFIIATRENVLMVPTAALRWKPQVAQITPAARATFTGRASRGPNEGQKPPADKAKDQTEHGTVWVLQGDGYVRPVRVGIGVTDGTNTEIIEKDDELPEHAVLVTGRIEQDSGGGGGTNPFVATPFGQKKQ